jgi:SAM-dependent methyltransferase
MTAAEIEAHPVYRFRWYHHLELAPGLFTRTDGHLNVVLTRYLLQRCSVTGLTCLDIGVMDGMISFLLERRQAKRVVAYDRHSKPVDPISNGDRFRFVHQVMQSKAEYVWDIPLSRLRNRLSTPFDVVVFSGVMYHMFDPMSGLGYARSLVRNGGLLLIETAAILDPDALMYFNSHGRYHPGADFWFTSVGCLDYLMRYFRLKILDTCYLECFPVESRMLLRVAMVCRALPNHLAEESDNWMRLQDTGLIHPDFKDCVDWADVESAKPEVPYSGVNEQLVLHPSLGSVNLYETLKSTPPLDLTKYGHLRTLRLDDVAI